MLAVVGLSACSGRKTVTEQYKDRVNKIHEKYDAELIKPNARMVASDAFTCADFISRLKEKYSHWSHEDAHFCSRELSLKERRDFEARVRAIHNKAVTAAKMKRLAHLEKLYREAKRTELAEEVQAISQKSHPSRSTRSAARGTPKDPPALGPAGEQLPYAEDADDQPKPATLHSRLSGGANPASAASVVRRRSMVETEEQKNASATQYQAKSDSQASAVDRMQEAPATLDDEATEKTTGIQPSENVDPMPTESSMEYE